MQILEPKQIKYEIFITHCILPSNIPIPMNIIHLAIVGVPHEVDSVLYDLPLVSKNRIVLIFKTLLNAIYMLYVTQEKVLLGKIFKLYIITSYFTLVRDREIIIFYFGNGNGNSILNKFQQGFHFLGRGYGGQTTKETLMP